MHRADRLRPYQHRIIDFVRTHPIGAVLVDMGLGKTISTLTAIASLPGKTLVVAPKRPAATVGADEAPEICFGGWHAKAEVDKTASRCGCAHNQYRSFAVADYAFSWQAHAGQAGR
jgi:hypothetical protein